MLIEHFLVNSFFIGANIRSHIQEGLGDYTPIMLIDIPHLFDSGQIPLDAVLMQVSPPTRRCAPASCSTTAPRSPSARRAGFTAEVLRGNKRMQAVFNHSGLRVNSRVDDDVYSFEMEFD